MALYDDYVVAATNKTLWLRSSSLSLSNNDPVTTWNNEAGDDYSGSGSTRPTYLTSQLNGQPSVRFTATDQVMDTSLDTYTAFGGDNDLTLFIYGRASAAQATDEANHYNNAALLADDFGYFGIHFRLRQIVINYFSAANQGDATGVSYSDNAPFCFAWSINNALTAIRRNFNGSITTDTVAWGGLGVAGYTMGLGANYFNGISNFDLFELIVTSDQKSSTDMDNIVLGLTEKYTATIQPYAKRTGGVLNMGHGHNTKPNRRMWRESLGGLLVPSRQLIWV